jgi:hypothetical protein
MVSCGQARDGNCLFVAVSRVIGEKRLRQITTNSQASQLGSVDQYRLKLRETRALV